MVDVGGFAPACFRPSMVTCQASVWLACVRLGTSAMPSSGAPLFHAGRKGSRSTASTPEVASYDGCAEVLQSVAGGALVDPTVPSVNDAVTRQASIFALAGDNEPSALDVSTYRVIVPLSSAAPPR